MNTFFSDLPGQESTYAEFAANMLKHGRALAHLDDGTHLCGFLDENEKELEALWWSSDDALEMGRWKAQAFLEGGSDFINWVVEQIENTDLFAKWSDYIDGLYTNGELKELL